MKLVFVLLVLVAGTHVMGTGLLFPHTQNNGDQLGPIGNDESIERIFKVPFKYWGKIFNSVHIYENGVLDFKGGFADNSPTSLPISHERLILPYWADHDITATGEGAHIWSRETKDKDDKDLYARADTAVHDNFCDPDFKTKRLFIVTWQRVQSFNCNNKRRDVDMDTHVRGPVEKRSHCGQNSYQVVLINGGDTGSYVMINYHTLEWDEGAVSGFNKGTASGNFVMLPDQGTDLADDTNVGLTGRWMFKIDSKPKEPAGC